MTDHVYTKHMFVLCISLYLLLDNKGTLNIFNFKQKDRKSFPLTNKANGQENAKNIIFTIKFLSTSCVSELMEFSASILKIKFELCYIVIVEILSQVFSSQKNWKM